MMPDASFNGEVLGVCVDDDFAALHRPALISYFSRQRQENPYLSIEDAEDLAQEVLKRATRSPHRIPATNPRRYLYGIASRVYADFCRKGKLRAGAEEGFGALRSRGEEDPEKTALDRLQVEEARRVAANLPPKQQQAVQRAIDDEPIGDLKRVLWKARITFRRLLGGNYLWPFAWPKPNHHQSAQPLMMGARGLFAACALIGVAVMLCPAQPATAAHGSPLVSFNAPRPDAPAAPTNPESLAVRMPMAGVSLPAAYHRPSSNDPNPGGLLSPPAYEETTPLAFSADPDFPQSRTLLAVTASQGCSNPYCLNLFRSVDTGGTWSRLSAVGLAATQLLLPRSSTRSGRFQAFGPGGLQETTDGGRIFSTVLPGRSGSYASVAPAWTSAFTAISGPEVLGYGGMPAVSPLALLPPGSQASGAPLFLTRRQEFLQPIVSAEGMALPTFPQIAACIPGGNCTRLGTLPWAAVETQLGSLEGADELVVAWGAGRLAISTNGAGRFNTLSPAAGRMVGFAGISRTADRVRLFATIQDGPEGYAGVFSDDLGSTWSASTTAWAVDRKLRAVSRLADRWYIGTVAPARPGEAWATTLSDDGGATWETLGR